ncbi:MAG: OmpA family protein [Flavobacteriales bacterium]|nr:OmpA family protein [Flavobacteriales bacterium]
MKRLFIAIIALFCSITFLYSQEREYAKLYELVSNGYYDNALVLAEQLSKFKNSNEAKWVLGYIYFKKRDYFRSVQFYNDAKKNRKKFSVVPIWYFIHMKQIYEYNKNYDQAIKYLLDLRSKINEMPQKEYEKYVSKYVDDRSVCKDVANQITYLDYEIKRLNYLQNNKISTIEYEKLEKIKTNQKGIFTGIGYDQINQELVSIKLQKDEGIEVNSKDKFKSYYQPYGFKFTENENRTIPALRSHFYSAGITFDPIQKKYIYAKQHTQTVELKKKELKNKPVNYRNYMAFFESPRIDETATIIPLNYDNSDFIHPIITANGKVLYFATNKGNANLQFDIAYVTRNTDNSWDWDNMKLLNENINTPMNELYPTVSGDSLLTFSSNGYMGYGGYDIIGIRLVDGLPVGEPFIYPSPINSHRDDFGYKFTEERVAVFFSNRDSITIDEKYKIEYPLPFVSLIVKFYDKNLKIPIDNAEFNLSSGNINKKYIINNGYLKIDSLLPKFLYDVELMKDKYIILDPKRIIKYEKNQKIIEIEFLGYKKLEKKDKLEFRDILFEYNKADLLPQSFVELNKIIQIIKENPYAKFELSAHTDSRGKDNYNLKLSQKRAESCVKYLLSNGVSSDAIIAKGYGEKQLKNHCKNNVNCTEDEHAVNRRVEIRVIDIKQ